MTPKQRATFADAVFVVTIIIAIIFEAGVSILIWLALLERLG